MLKKDYIDTIKVKIPFKFHFKFLSIPQLLDGDCWILVLARRQSKMENFKPKPVFILKLKEKIKCETFNFIN